MKSALIQPMEVKHLDLKYYHEYSLDSSLNELKLLEYIDLSRSYTRRIFKGVILKNVSTLDLSFSNYDVFELNNLALNFPNLKNLNLNQAGIYYLPGEIGSFSKLEELNLSGNQIEFLPFELENLQKLKRLNLSNNNLIFNNNSLSYLWNLEELILSNNPKQDLTSLLNSISENSNLKKLELDGNSLGIEDFKILSKMNIQTLILNSTFQSINKNIKQIKSLQKLHIKNSKKVVLNSLLKKTGTLPSITFSNSTFAPKSFAGAKLDTLILSNIDSINVNLFKGVLKINVLDISESIVSLEDLEKLKNAFPKTKIISKTHLNSLSQSKTIEKIFSLENTIKKISSDKETIFSESNATFYIPPQAFLTKNGTVYFGEVTIEVKVYNDAIDLALEGAPMTFTRNGKEELFGSNGMMYFLPKTESGERLFVNPSAEIQVEMKNNIPQELGNMYVYDNETRNWQQTNNQVITFNKDDQFNRIIDSLNKLNLNLFINTSVNDRKYGLKIKPNKYEQTQLNFFSTFNKRDNTTRVIYYNRSNQVGKELCNYTWAVDTTLSKVQINALKKIQRETKLSSKKKFFKRKSSRFTSRPIWNMTIEIDPSRDNYRLKFNYKDSSISLPVSIHATLNSSSQKIHAKFANRLANARKKDEREKDKFEKFKEKNFDKLAKKAREEFIKNAIANKERFLSNLEIIRFGLASFGLVNCDIISREKPLAYISLKESFKDQDGNLYKTPSNVRIVMKDFNSYLPVESSNIPVYQNSVILIPINSSNLGIIPVNKILNSFRIPSAEVIRIDSMTSEEIRKRIESNYGRY